MTPEQEKKLRTQRDAVELAHSIMLLNISNSQKSIDALTDPKTKQLLQEMLDEKTEALKVLQELSKELLNKLINTKGQPELPF